MGHGYDNDTDADTKKRAGNANGHAPSPKGDPGKKPVPSNGAAPVPKAFEMPNPTYMDAKFYAEKYFRRQAETASFMHDAATTGFDTFKSNTDAAFERTDTLAGQLFELAIATSSSAGFVVLAFMKTMRAGVKLTELQAQIREAAEATKETAEGINSVREAVEKGQAIPEASKSRSEATERADFMIEASNSILDMALESVKERWNKEDNVDTLLSAVEYAPPTVDLMRVVRRALPSMPEAADVVESSENTKSRFEYLLYYQYYAESGKATNVVYTTEDDDSKLDDAAAKGERKVGDIENVPARVLERIQTFGKMNEFKQAVAAFNTQHRRSLGHQAKPLLA